MTTTLVTPAGQTITDAPRVFLRKPVPEDGDEFLAMVLRSQPLHSPWMSPPRTPGEFNEYLNQCRTDTFEGLLACRREDGAIVGVINLSQIFMKAFRSAYSGYFAHVDHAGRGYMTEGLRLAIDHAFGPLGLHRVEANIQPGNEASRRLVRRLGFTLEGYSPRYLFIDGAWRDHERWAITLEDWPPPSNAGTAPSELG